MFAKPLFYAILIIIHTLLTAGDWEETDCSSPPKESVSSSHTSSADVWRQSSAAIDSNDDDYGFDPFEETNKALAQDIMMEKQREQREKQQLHQRQQQQSFQQLQQQQLQQAELQNSQSSLKNFLGNSMGAARLPPPGFNGVSLPNVSNNPQHRVDMSKLLPLLSGMNSSNIRGTISTPPPLNGLVSNGLASGPPPGLGMLHSLSGQQQSIDTGGTNNALLAALDVSVLTQQQQPGPPPGLALPKPEQFSMKDLDSELRASFQSTSALNRMNSLNSLNSSANCMNVMNPSINSFSNINSLPSMSPLVSLNSGGGGINNANLNFGGLNLPQQQQQQQQQNSLSSLGQMNAFPGLNLPSTQQQHNSVNQGGSSVLSNLFNFGQQQQQQQQVPPQSSLLHHLALQNAQKGKVS